MLPYTHTLYAHSQIVSHNYQIQTRLELGNANITIRDAGSTAPKTKRGTVGGRVGGPLNTLPQISIFGHYLTPKQCENSPQDISNQNNLTGTKKHV